MNSARAANRATISAFIICCNEERNIERCLNGISWCDEIVVVDSGSTDRTLEIAKGFTSKIHQRPWPGYVAQKQFALAQCTSEWVLNVDADEVVSPELREQILAALADSSAEAQRVDGYLLSRVVFYLNRWWRSGGWYPEYRLRLCRRAKTIWGGEDPHEKASVAGETRRLNGELQHFTYSSISNQVQSLNKFADTSAQTMFRKGVRSSWAKIFFRPPARFFKFFVLRAGFREGFPGFIVACLEANYVFLKYVKLWELEKVQRKSKD
jgi:glycosyltransferase involved in cell wall biosynthesis